MARITDKLRKQTTLIPVIIMAVVMPVGGNYHYTRCKHGYQYQGENNFADTFHIFLFFEVLLL